MARSLREALLDLVEEDEGAFRFSIIKAWSVLAKRVADEFESVVPSIVSRRKDLSRGLVNVSTGQADQAVICTAQYQETKNPRKDPAFWLRMQYEWAGGGYPWKVRDPDKPQRVDLVVNIDIWNFGDVGSGAMGEAIKELLKIQGAKLKKRGDRQHMISDVEFSVVFKDLDGFRDSMKPVLRQISEVTRTLADYMGEAASKPAT